jgi:UDP:flavonoid glycosyltransferase YjiC (YdhE family)
VNRPAQILAAMFQGGGNIPLLMPVMAGLVAQGHHLRILAGPGVRPSRLPISESFRRRMAASGAEVVPFQEPDRHPYDRLQPTRGLIGGWVPKQFQTITGEARGLAWASAWAENVTAELRRAPADILVSDYVLLGALAAAEAAGVPSVALMHAVAERPLPGVPPDGPGWQPGLGLSGKLRDAIGHFVLNRLYRRDGLSLLNDARVAHGLVPLRSGFEQYDRAALVLMLVSSSFDFPAKRLPANMQHVGTPIDDSETPEWLSPWSYSKARRPLVLVSLSTLEQGQASLLQRILLALGQLDVHGLVTLGPALDPAQYAAPPNVLLERFVPHSAVLPQADVLVTQCGIGTLTKGLIHGVPLVCAPLRADQPDNAARVVARGAGIKISKDAPAEQISAAIQRVLSDQRFRTAARRLGDAMVRDGDAVENAVQAIERVL